MTSSRRGALAGVLASLLVATASACGDDPMEIQFERVTEVSYASAFVTAANDTLTVDLGMMTELSTGVWIQDLVVGTGDTAVLGDTMFVSYTGWLRDGAMFDDGQFDFIFFDGRTAIGGFHHGTQSMQVGGERLVIIPPEWAYGSASVGPIYPGAILVFDIVLDSIHPGP